MEVKIIDVPLEDKKKKQLAKKMFKSAKANENANKKGKKARLSLLKKKKTAPQSAAAPGLKRSHAAVRDRARRKLNIREILIVAVPTLVVIAVALVVLFFVRRASSYTFNGAAVQYYNNSTFRVQEGARLEIQKDGTYLLSGSSQSEMNNLPIYFQDRSAVVLPQSMVYFDPRTTLSARVEAFSELGVSGGSVSLSRNGKSEAISRGIIYDGENLYLFLEPMTLSFNGYQLQLGALSYVEADAQGQVAVYNSADGQMMMEAPRGSVTATAGGADYTVSLLGDSVTMHDGTKVLLFNRPELLDKLM